MFAKKLTAAAAALALSTGLAFAQAANQPMDGQAGTQTPDPTQTQAVGSNMTYQSEAEESWWSENTPLFGQFFTDETMAEMSSDEEIAQTFAAMGADDQASVRAACERASQDRGSYGSVTNDLCERVGQM